MRPIKHLTPRYIVNRLNEMAYRRANLGTPWLTPAANAFLAGWLKPTDRGAEFGSGGSTVFFAARVGALVSVEHNPAWHAEVTKRLAAIGAANVDLRLRPEAEGVAEADQPYVREAHALDDASLDFALVDGVLRDHCALAVLPKLKPGGVLVVDNINLELPNESLAPNSLRAADGPRTEAWGRFAAATAGWRRYWTTNGITDTAIFFKP